MFFKSAALSCLHECFLFLFSPRNERRIHNNVACIKSRVIIHRHSSDHLNDLDPLLLLLFLLHFSTRAGLSSISIRESRWISRIILFFFLFSYFLCLPSREIIFVLHYNDQFDYLLIYLCVMCVYNIYYNYILYFVYSVIYCILLFIMKENYFILHEQS